MNLFWDTDKRRLVESYSDDTTVNEITIAARDVETFAVAMLARTGTPATPFSIKALPAGAQIVFGAKYDLDGVYCTYGDVFVQSGSGDDIVHTGDCNFNTAGTLAALADEDDVLVKGEIALILSTGKKAWSTQFTIRIVADVVRGETPPMISGGGQAVRFLVDAAGARGLGMYNYDGVLMAAYWPPGVEPVEPIEEAT